MKKLAAAFFLYCLAISANAGESIGVISYYFVTLYGKVFFHAGTATARPACSVNGDWAIDLVGPNAAAGKAMLATVIAANAQGKSVHIVGTGACDVWGDRETVHYIVVDT